MLGYYLSLAVSSIRRSWALSGLIVLAVAVGIGASMTTLTVTYLLSGDPLPGRSADIFYPQLDADPTARAPHEPPDMLDYRSAIDLWQSAKASRQALVVDSAIKVSAPASAMPQSIVPMLSTTADFFSMFDVPFAYGTGWHAQDDLGHARVAVISESLNNRLFGGADSVGRVIRLNDDTLRIVGVLASWRPSPLFYAVAGGASARGRTADFYGKPEDVLTPFFTGLEINKGKFQPFDCWRTPSKAGELEEASCTWLQLWVELDSPARQKAYRQFLDGYAAQQKQLGRITYAANTRLPTLMEWLDHNKVVPSDVRTQTWLAFAFLLVCLCNAVGILLTKFLSRSSEFGMRRALGATRRAIFAQCLTEAAALGLLGGMLGLLFTCTGLWLIRSQPTPYADLIHLNAPMFAATLGLAVLASLLSGTLPAMRASAAQPALLVKIP